MLRRMLLSSIGALFYTHSVVIQAGTNMSSMPSSWVAIVTSLLKYWWKISMFSSLWFRVANISKFIYENCHITLKPLINLSSSTITRWNTQTFRRKFYKKYYTIVVELLLETSKLSTTLDIPYIKFTTY